MKKIFTIALLSYFFIFKNELTNAQVSALPFSMSLGTFGFITGDTLSHPMDDDINYPLQPIGFDFVFNNDTFQTFGCSSNGCIRLGALTTTSYTPSSITTNYICVLMQDLQNSNSGGTLQFTTAGVAPNRILIVQWQDWGRFATPLCHFNFQVLLYETSNCVQLRYGSCISGINGGLPVHAGIIGNGSSDFNLRTSAVNDWLFNQPQVNYNPGGLTLNSLTNLPSGLIFDFGNCAGNSGATFSFLTGTIYNDLNNNGAQDAGENGIANALVHETNYNHYANTDANGIYNLFFTDSTLTYNLATSPIMYWSQSSAPTTWSVTPQTQSCNGNDFGWYATPNVHDLGLAQSYSQHIGFIWNHTMFLTVTNNGTVTETGTLQLIKDAHLVCSGANPAVSSVNGDTITWNFSGLNPLAHQNFSIQYVSDTTVNLNDTMHNTLSVSCSGTDANPSDNDAAQTIIADLAWDPNYKEVFPNGDILNGTPLTYTIHFQNTGSATAQNVKVLDTLDANLNPMTFEIVESSHSITSWTINGSGNLQFNFQNILLPDSGANFAGSMGSLTYHITPMTALSVGTQLHGTASIVFDFNVPVQTNTTLNTIVELNAVQTIMSENASLHFFPNPANDELSVQTSSAISKIELYDVQGKLLKTISSGSTKNNLTISLNEMKNGIYFITAYTTDGNKMNGRFVKL